MSDLSRAGTFPLGDLSVTRMGYGAMRLSGPYVFGPPSDRAGAVAVLRAAIDAGIDHLDTSDLRMMFSVSGTAEGDIEEPLTALAELQQQGLIRHIGLSNVTAKQIAQGQSLTRIAGVQNMYNLAARGDDALIDQLAQAGIAYVPFFPLGGFSPLQSSILTSVAERLGATPMQVALAWLLQRSPNVLLIPGTSSVEHLRENLAAIDLDLPADCIAELDGIAAST